MLSRRQVLELGLKAWALSHGISLAGAGARAREKRAPRYYVLFSLPGGIDPVWTTDPKVRSEVEGWIDVPYGRDAILDAGDVQMGPHLAPLARHAHRLAIVNGVNRRTANHPYGHLQFTRLRTGVHQQMPTIMDIIGRHREGQPMGCISIGVEREDYSAGWFGDAIAAMPGGEGAGRSRRSTLFEAIDQAAPAELAQLGRVLQAEAARIGRAGMGAEGRATASNLEQCAALFRQMETVPPFTVAPWSKDKGEQQGAKVCQRILWALENDLTRCVYVRPSFNPWDSHADNAAQQGAASSAFFSQLSRFLTELETRSNRHGPLGANTVLVLGSELGRLPRLNSKLGKDHFPEAPMLFLGPGIRTDGKRGAVYGRTGRQMQALPTSLRTGRDVAAGGHMIDLDDVGTTLLHLAGLDPATYGYTGRLLEFLVDA